MNAELRQMLINLQASATEAGVTLKSAHQFVGQIILVDEDVLILRHPRATDGFRTAIDMNEIAAVTWQGATS